MNTFLYIFFAVLIAQGDILSQNFNVDQQIVSISGGSSESNISNNTYLNALSNATLTWTVSNISIPPSWEYSFCFPNCFAIGQTSGTIYVTSGESYYLNCHVYPNNVSGEGSITMLIEDSHGPSIEVTWEINAGVANLEENSLQSHQTSIKAIFNMEGKRLTELIKNQIQFVSFEDNSQKIIFIAE